MDTIKNIIQRIAILLGLSVLVGVGATVATTSDAHASVLCDSGVSCGQLKAVSGSTAFHIYRDWGSNGKPASGSPRATLRAGETSTKYFPKSVGGTDGFEIAAGWCAERPNTSTQWINRSGTSPKFVQIHDDQHFSIFYWNC
jgi:hypothetical protein